MQETQQARQPQAAATPIWKDLLIPGSIMIAGAAIGFGLFFSGGGTAPVAPVAAAPTPAAQEQVDRTDQIKPVTAEDYRKGPADAAVTIVEYSDFDCPFCSRFHDSMNDIMADSSDVAWVYRHFPLEQLHPQAEDVAIAAECVGELAGSDAFWSFTDDYFAARGAGDSTAHDVLIPQLADSAGVSNAALSECVTSGRTQPLVQEDIDNAIATGGRGTPWSILVGPTGKTYPLNGALPTATIEQLIQIARDEA
jgi:protein-disulfide isomerase